MHNHRKYIHIIDINNDDDDENKNNNMQFVSVNILVQNNNKKKLHSKLTLTNLQVKMAEADHEIW